eukprot:417671-Pelagomonas_calceolata.AAC.4
MGSASRIESKRRAVPPCPSHTGQNKASLHSGNMCVSAAAAWAPAIDGAVFCKQLLHAFDEHS